MTANDTEITLPDPPRNPAVVLRDTRYTHDPAVLAAQHLFTAINAAITTVAADRGTIGMSL